MVGGEVHPPLLVRGRMQMLVGAQLLLLQQPADVGLLVVPIPPLPLLLLMLLVVVVAVVFRLLVGGRLLLLVVASAWPHLEVLVLMVLLHRVFLLTLLHVLVLVGDRRLLFKLGDNVLLLVGSLVLSLVVVVVLVLWQQQVLFHGQVLLLFKVVGGLQLGVSMLMSLVVLPMLLVVGVLHVGFLRLRLMLLVCGRVLQYLLLDIETPLVGRFEDVVVRVAVVTGAGSRLAIAHGGIGGGAPTSGANAARWHHVVDGVVIVACELRHFVVDAPAAIDSAAGTIDACVNAGWRAVLGIRRLRVANGGAVIGVVTNACGLRAHAVGVVAATATRGATAFGWHHDVDVFTDVVVVVVAGGGVVAITTTACVDADWRMVVGIRMQRAATGGNVIGVVIDASGQRVAPRGAFGGVATTCGATAARLH
jgi:hypothetical protein